MTSVQNKWIDTIHLKDFGICRKKSGQHVLYQTSHMTEAQLRGIKKTSIPIIFLFGDNERDKLRDKTKEKRLGTAGQASVGGKPEFEDSVCCGIITLWYSKYSFEKKIDLWEDTFRYLLERIHENYTIVVPSPSKQDLDKYQHKFFGTGNQQVIFHNLGTGIADAPVQELQALQNFLDNLEQKTVSSKPCYPLKHNSEQREREKPKDSGIIDDEKFEVKEGEGSEQPNNLQKIVDQLIEIHTEELKKHSIEKQNLENENLRLLRENEQLRSELEKIKEKLRQAKDDQDRNPTLLENIFNFIGNS